MQIALPPAAAAATSDPLVVGVEAIEYSPAYSYRDGQYGGFARALLDAFAHDSKRPIQYVALPVARLYAAFLQGTVAFKYPDSPLWAQAQKRDHAITYSAPVAIYIDGVNVRPELRGRPVETIKRLGIVRGFTAWEWLDRIHTGTVALTENDDFVSLLQTTLLGRNDGAYANVNVVQYQLKRSLEQPGALVFDPSLPYAKGTYHLSSIKDPETVRAFDAWMAEHGPLIAQLKATFEVELGF